MPTDAEGSVTVIIGPQVDLSFSSCDDIEITSLNFLLSGDYEYRLMFYNTNSINLQSIVISTEDESSNGSSAILSQASVISISDSSFVGISGHSGAAIQALDSSKITFSGTINFTNNSAKLGGAIHSTNSTLQFDEMSISVFIGNTAASNVSIMPRNDTASTVLYENDINIILFKSGIGGAVYVNHSQFLMSGCAQFLFNNALNLGGAVAAVSDSVVVINGSLCSKYNNDSSIVFDSNNVTTEGEIPFNAIGSGGAIYIHGSKANISNISLFNNYSPIHGGAAYFVQSDVLLMNAIATTNMANKWFGGALRFYQCTHVHINGESSFINNYARSYGGAIEFCDVQSLSIAGVNYFEGNRANYGGAFDVFNTLYIATAASIGGEITFKHNNGVKPDRDGTSSGGAVYVYDSTLDFSGYMEYENNTAGDGGAISCYSSSEIHFYSDNVTLFQNNRAENSGGAIHVEDSRIIYHAHTSDTGESQFENNTAKYGGAIAMHGNAKLILNPNTSIVFIENQAKIHGGAIFVDTFTTSECQAGTSYVPECFIHLNICYSSFNRLSDEFLLNFTNNSADKRGHVLYGGRLNECRRLFKTGGECGTSMNHKLPIEIVKNISMWIPYEDKNYTFSSKPNSLCIHNENSTDLCELPEAINVSPGEMFSVSLVTIDQYSNSIEGVQVMSNQTNTNDYQITYMSNHTSETNSSLILFYQVFVSNESLVENENKLSFSLFTEPDGNCRNSTDFNITVKPCPLGFKFSSDIQKCSCAELFQKFTDCGDCIIEDITIGRSSNTAWMDLTPDSILLHDGGCPLNYCKYEKVYVPQNNSDVQCNDGRIGILCGSCMEYENYSLVLGTLACKQNCSDTHLSLVLPIAALGILLIVALFVLRLTVAAGTINGLLFYANIVQANHQTFLPTDTSNPLKHFYTIFLSWLNLDFGIEACFYDGMDIYAYSWLQFLFPVYLWILMFIIILSARYSQRVAHNLGQNPVAVLATVLLISYGKMLKAIIVPLSWAKLQKYIVQENSNLLISNDTESVWLYNGNISYSDHNHTALVVVASLVLLFLFLPYSLLLLCSHWLQAKSHWRILSWINKLKPFMDAYHAPYKKNNRHWIGLFLLARCSLVLTFAFDATGVGDQHLNLLIIISLTAILSIFKGRVYEKWYNDFLESSFLLNLCLLSVATIYVQSEKSSTYNPQKIIDNQIKVTTVSVGIAFIFFIGIMVFHTRQRMKDLDLFSFFQSVRKRCRLCFKKQSKKTMDKEQSMEMITKSNVCLRELLLDDDSQI
jgi:predicted outer membrane repeat protein